MGDNPETLPASSRIADEEGTQEGRDGQGYANVVACPREIHR